MDVNRKLNSQVKKIKGYGQPQKKGYKGIARTIITTAVASIVALYNSN